MRFYFTGLLWAIPLLLLGQTTSSNKACWGIYTALETQSLGIEPLDSREPDKATVLSGRPHTGWAAGVFYRHQWWKKIAIQPGISFSSGKNRVEYRQDGIERYTFHDVELPVHVIFTNYKNDDALLQGKVCVGGRMGYNLAKNPEDRLSFYPHRVAIDIGLGVDIRMSNLIISPEIIYSHGMNNLHNFTGKPYDALVGQVVRDKLSFRISVMFHRSNKSK